MKSRRVKADRDTAYTAVREGDNVEVRCYIGRQRAPDSWPFHVNQWPFHPADQFWFIHNLTGDGRSSPDVDAICKAIRQVVR